MVISPLRCIRVLIVLQRRSGGLVKVTQSVLNFIFYLRIIGSVNFAVKVKLCELRGNN